MKKRIKIQSLTQLSPGSIVVRAEFTYDDDSSEVINLAVDAKLDDEHTLSEVMKHYTKKAMHHTATDFEAKKHRLEGYEVYDST